MYILICCVTLEMPVFLQVNIKETKEGKHVRSEAVRTCLVLYLATLFNYFEYLKEYFSRGRDCRPTTKAEVLTLTVILNIAGVVKANHLNINDLWEADLSDANFVVYNVYLFVEKYR